MFGQTPSGHTFSLDFCYMEWENDNGYIWALQELKMLFQTPKIPKVIITDREPALNLAIELVFPSSIHNYCTWHISKNLIQNCPKYFKRMIASINSKDYAGSWAYISNNLLLFKKLFFTVWASQHPHLGNQASSCVQSANSYIKSFINNSNGELSKVFQNFKTAIDIQLKPIHHTKGKERV
ncbi:hypothetical protein O181_029769 [Austropuccinia psidii MF-1]|uniref:MULE transposase domain-containing protein n=1 Tax=Austropuccinia psidii MF-1 TaxID=1389203 RepID=A0A9Q3CSV7_9BASI|nr:hypothetical protein [Austropuccinia psidii MF-1]